MVRKTCRQGYATEALEQRRLLAVAGPYFLDFTLELPTGRFSNAAVQADINGDGVQDLVSYNSSSFGIFGFVGYGNGTFGPATPLAEVANTTKVVPADFNEDGYDDLVLIATGGSASLLLSMPSGTYLKSNLISGNEELTIGVADVDGDGHADIISTSAVSGASSAVLLRGSGDGTFQPAAQLSPHLSYAGFIGAADLDGDGNLDLLVRTRLDPTSVDPYGFAFLRGMGDGTFESHLFGAQTNGLLLVDATGDGKLDIVGSDNTTLAVMPGIGDGTFGAPISSPTQFGTASVTDFDRDGVPDVIVDYAGSAYLQRGRGDGTFEAPVQIVQGTATISRMLVADLNQDGTADLVSPRSSNTLSLYFGDGAGGLLPRLLPADLAAMTTLLAVDLNGDGREDLATYYNSGIRIRLQNADGTFGSSSGLSTVAFGALANGDVDNDGDIDLLVVARPDSHLLRNNGDGTFARATISGAPSGILKQSFTADFNSDGADDLFVAVSSGYFVSISNGDGTFAPAQSLGVTGEGAIAADLNGDGATDLTYASGSSLQTLLGNDDGTFRDGQNIPVAATSSGVKLFAGRFNSDPFPDVVMTKDRGVYVFAGKADGTLGQPRATILSVTPRVLISDDIDSDGREELITVGDHPFVLDVRDDGTVAAVTPLDNSVSTSSPGLIATADVNRDGRRDVLIAVTGLVTPPFAFLNVGTPIAPSLLDARYDVDSRQVSFRFDAPLLAASVTLADLDMTAVSSGARVNPTAVNLSADGRSVVFTLPTFLPDGDYHIAIRAGAVTSVDGLQSTADATMPSQQSFILAGDLNRDRVVNFDDLLTLSQNFGQTGKTFSQGNIDYSPDGLVGFDDLLILAQRYGTSVLEVKSPQRKARTTAEAAFESGVED